MILKELRSWWNRLSRNEQRDMVDGIILVFIALGGLIVFVFGAFFTLGG